MQKMGELPTDNGMTLELKLGNDTPEQSTIFFLMSANDGSWGAVKEAIIDQSHSHSQHP